MGLFAKLYDVTMTWAAKPQAPKYLGAVSFADSSFFPIPPDVMLLPMSVSQPHRAWYFAFITTVTSILGAILGYLIGYLAIDLLMPWIEQAGYKDKYDLMVATVEKNGVWAVAIAAVTPIPYKIATITAGALSMLFWPFLLISIVCRGARFYLVAGIARYAGPWAETHLLKYIDLIGWALVLLAITMLIIY